MKRITICVILCTLLCSCGIIGRGNYDVSDESGSASGSAVAVSGSSVVGGSAPATGSPVATGSPAPTKSPVHREKFTPGIVVDETGKKHKLELGNVNVEKVEMIFPLMMFPTNYSQVADNHYYFLRADGRLNYTIYRDKGEVVGEFSLKEGIVYAFGFYRNRFYAEIAKSNTNDIGKKLVEIDLKRTKNLCYAAL